MRQAIITILFMGCGETKLPSSGQGSSNAPGTEPTEAVSCPDSWTEGEDGEWYDPVACAAWSPVSDTLNWHEAVSSAEANTGGCDTICDNDTDTDYCAQLSLGGLSNWRVPTISELEELATQAPPFTAMTYDLWSLNSDSMDNLAWTANLDQPGMSVLLEKSSGANVRCIAD